MDGRVAYNLFKMEDGRNFKIYKMTPQMGIAVLKELLTRSLPIDLLGMFDLAGNNKLKSMMSFSKSYLKPMDIDEFAQFQERLLSNVYQVLPSGEVPIIDNFGNYKVEGLSEDLNLVLKLEFEVVKVNYQDFFLEIFQELKLIMKADEDQQTE